MGYPTQPWEYLLTLWDQSEKTSVNVSDLNLAVHLTDGYYAGSIFRLSSFNIGVRTKSTSAYSNYLKPRHSVTKTRIRSVSFKIGNKSKQIVFSNYYVFKHSIPKFEGSSARLIEYSGENILKETILEPKDCFGAAYEKGKIVSYKRENKQVFAVVEDISKQGRIKLRRIYNKDPRQKFDYINYAYSQENLIIDTKLLDKLMVMRIKTE